MFELHAAFSDTAYNQDGLVSMHHHDFMSDPAFVAAYARGVKAAGTDYGWHWRVHIGLWASRAALRVPGDYVECGVNRGFMSSSIMHHLDWDRLGRRFYLLDTFKGVDPRYLSETEKDAGAVARNRLLIDRNIYVTDSEPVRRNFSEWTMCRIIEGAIPETLEQIDAVAVAFLHVDLNCALPEVEAVEHLWDRLSPGAIVLLDDYAYAGYEHQKAAMDAWSGRSGVPIVSLPTGQGLFIKP